MCLRYSATYNFYNMIGWNNDCSSAFKLVESSAKFTEYESKYWLLLEWNIRVDGSSSEISWAVVSPVILLMLNACWVEKWWN